MAGIDPNTYIWVLDKETHNLLHKGAQKGGVLNYQFEKFFEYYHNGLPAPSSNDWRYFNSADPNGSVLKFLEELDEIDVKEMVKKALDDWELPFKLPKKVTN